MIFLDCKLDGFSTFSLSNMCILEGVFSGNLSSDVSEGSTWRIRRYGFCGMRSKKVLPPSFFRQEKVIPLTGTLS
jgi:hypothetical protein